MSIRAGKSGPAGFTLIEVLVTLTLIAAIVAIIAPTLFSQLDQGDATQVRGDVQNVANAIKTFRVDVSPKFPGDVEDLVNKIDDTNDAQLGGSDGSYTPGDTTRWNGPYLEVEGFASDPASSTVAFTTGFGGDVRNGLIDGDGTNSVTGTTSGWVVIQVDALSSSALTTIDQEFDDAASSTGRFRHDDSSILWYLAVQK